MSDEKVTRRGFSLLGIPLVAGALAALAGKREAAAQTQEAANKTSAMVARGDLQTLVPGQTVLILEEIVKTSKPTDLILGVTAESSIITQVTTVGNDEQSATGRIEIFVTIDGNVVPTGANPPQTDPGTVVFANRTYERETTLFDDEDATIRTYMNTRHAAGFNWMAFNVGSGTHRIRVFARYTEAQTTTATAEGVIGTRSLIVEPVKAFVRETITLN